MSQDKTTSTPPTYKEQLDEAAIKVKNSQGETNEGGVIDQVVDKVAQYVPAVGKALGKDQKEEDSSSREETKVPGPPERPRHDIQIEEFIKDQHQSKCDDGKLT